jgi:Spy/CpxP family protein refolding chaperone
VSSNAKAALIVVVAFIAGLFVGVAGDRFVMFRTARRAGEGTPPGHLVSYLNRELKLNDSQRAQIERIVNDHRARMDAVFKNVQPQMRQEIDAASAAIEAVLTPEQQVKFKQMRERAEKRRGGRGFLRH